MAAAHPRSPRVAEYFSSRWSNGCPRMRRVRPAHSQVPRGRRKRPDEAASNRRCCAPRAALDCGLFPRACPPFFPRSTSRKRLASDEDSIDIRPPRPGDSIWTAQTRFDLLHSSRRANSGLGQWRLALRRKPGAQSGGAHGLQVALLDAFLKRFYVRHLKPPAGKSARPWLVPNRGD